MPRSTNFGIKSRTWVGYVWLALLCAVLITSARSTERRVRFVEEYPCCCDPFGYLQMADDIRRGHSSGTGPQFTFESDQTRLLIEWMKANNVPVRLWEHVVAPLCYHYFPEVDRVGVQYPPGVGLALALFPKDRALHGLGQVTTLIFLIVGIALLVIAAISRRWLSAGLAVLALVFGLDILARIDNASFSINAMLAPILLCGICLFAAFGMGGLSARSRLWLVVSWFLILIAGMLFGFAVLIRLPILLLMPGILVLLWTGSIRSWHRSGTIPFMLGALIVGGIPLMIYQHRMTGAWHRTTYPRYDSTLPTLDFLSTNFTYYFGPGKSIGFLWALPLAVAGFFGLYLWSRKGKATMHSSGSLLPNLTWLRVIVAAFLLWGVTLVYNLTHSVTGHYYPVPATFATVLLLGLCAFTLERNQVVRLKSSARTLRYLGLALVFIPGLVVGKLVWTTYQAAGPTILPRSFSLPAELVDERAWVWADHLSGTIWYYTGRPVHRLTWATPETREILYEYMRKRGEPQYLIADAPNAQPILEEIPKLGGKTTLKGEVAGHPYYVIEWPNPRGEIRLGS